MIIILEGIDGAGKTTVAEDLEKHFISMNKVVHRIQEPGSNMIGRVIRPIVKNSDISDTAALLLFSASNTETLNSLENAKEDHVYIVDRCVLSTVVYQHSNETGFYYVKEAIVNNLLRRTLNLGNIFVLDPTLALAMARIDARNDYDRFESPNGEIVKERYETYKNLAKMYNLPVIDTSSTVDGAVKAILNHLKQPNYKGFKQFLLNNEDVRRDVVKLVHNANRLVQKQTGESIPELNEHLIKSTLDGIYYVLDNPECTPEQQHKNWMAFKQQEGWKYGPIKDDTKKEHPCMLPYNQLPEIQQRKDTLFRTTIKQAMVIYGY